MASEGSRLAAAGPPAVVRRETELPVHQQAAPAQGRVQAGEPVEKTIHVEDLPVA
jgi:hypothetical protein